MAHLSDELLADTGLIVEVGQDGVQQLSDQTRLIVGCRVEGYQGNATHIQVGVLKGL